MSLPVRSKKIIIPTAKNGAHVGKTYQGVIDSGAGIRPIEANPINENLRTDGYLEAKKGKPKEGQRRAKGKPKQGPRQATGDQRETKKRAEGKPEPKAKAKPKK